MVVPDMEQEVVLELVVDSVEEQVAAEDLVVAVVLVPVVVLVLDLVVVLALALVVVLDMDCLEHMHVCLVNVCCKP